MQHIVIVGGGYAGLRAASGLGRRFASRDDSVRVTLIDRTASHQHIIRLHELAVGNVQINEAALDLAPLVQRRAVRFVPGTVTHIDRAARLVHLADGLALSYDWLILTPGAQTAYYDIPGAATHTFPLRSIAEALTLRQHLQATIAQAARSDDPTTRRTLLTVAIVGGGLTGVQMAGELAAWLPRLATQHGIPIRELRIALIERGGQLLGSIGDWAGGIARRVLAGRGISIHTKLAVEKVTPQRLQFAEGKGLRAGTIVWAAGIVAPPWLATSGLPTDARGRLCVERTLQLQGDNNGNERIFAAGDAARIPRPDGNSVAATASYAMRQGEHLEQALAAAMRGTTLPDYYPLDLGLLVSLGPGEALGTPLGVPTSGLPVWLLKQGVEAWYLTTL